MWNVYHAYVCVASVLLLYVSSLAGTCIDIPPSELSLSCEQEFIQNPLICSKSFMPGYCCSTCSTCAQECVDSTNTNNNNTITPQTSRSPTVPATTGHAINRSKDVFFTTTSATAKLHSTEKITHGTSAGALVSITPGMSLSTVANFKITALQQLTQSTYSSQNVGITTVGVVGSAALALTSAPALTLSTAELLKTTNETTSTRKATVSDDMDSKSPFEIQLLQQRTKKTRTNVEALENVITTGVVATSAMAQKTTGNKLTTTGNKLTTTGNKLTSSADIDEAGAASVRRRELVNEGISLCNLKNPTSDKDLSAWDNSGSVLGGKLSYSNDFQALCLRGGYFTGTTYATCTIDNLIEVEVSHLIVTASLIGRSLKPHNFCSLEATVDNGTTWFDLIVEVHELDLQIGTPEYDGVSDSAVIPIGAGLQLRLKFEAQSIWEFCYMPLLTVWDAAPNFEVMSSEMTFHAKPGKHVLPHKLFSSTIENYSPDTVAWTYNGTYSGPHVLPEFKRSGLRIQDKGTASLSINVDMMRNKMLGIYVVLSAKYLEDGDYCRFVISLHGEDNTVIMIKEVLSINSNQDTGALHDGEIFIHGDDIGPQWKAIENIHLQLVADVDQEQDQCYLHATGVSSME